MPCEAACKKHTWLSTLTAKGARIVETYMACARGTARVLVKDQSVNNCTHEPQAFQAVHWQ
jgi:hypothetical protein